MRSMKFVCAAVVALGLGVAVRAATVTVASGGDIQAAIDSARTDDIVELAAGTYTISAQIVVEKAITLRGATGNPADVVVERVTNPVRCLKVKAIGAVVENITFKNGLPEGNSEKDPENLSGSIAYIGDGVIRNCILEGGNAYNNKDSVHSVGVYMDGTGNDRCQLVNCVVRNNQNWEGDAKEGGGGVFIKKYGLVDGCMISNNVSRSNGGGVSCLDSFAEIRNSVIYDNYAGYINRTGGIGWNGGGGGAYGGNYIGCLIAANKNSSKGSGGGVSGVNAYNCTIVDNRSLTKDGGSQNSYLYNCIVTGNLGSKGATDNDCNSDYPDRMFRCITAPDRNYGSGTVQNNIYDDPHLVSLAIPGSTACAGFVYAFAPSQDAPSPAIDAGSNDYLNGATLDIGSGARVINGTVDIGCYETLPQSNENEIVTEFDCSASYRSVVYMVSITSRGPAAAASATARLIVSPNADLSEPVYEADVLTVTEDGLAVNSETPELLTPKSRYYVAVRTTNSLGNTVLSDIVAIDTVSEDIHATLEINDAYLSPAVNATVAAPGRGGVAVTRGTVRLWADAARTVKLAETTRTFRIENYPKSTETFVLSNVSGLVGGDTYYIDAILENDAGKVTTIASVEFTAPSGGDNVWANTGTDLADAASYVYNWVPRSGDSVYFESPAIRSPVVERDVTLFALRFRPAGGIQTAVDEGRNSCGYTLTGAGRLLLSGAPILEQSSVGTNEIRCPVVYRGADSDECRVESAYGELALGELSSSARDLTLKAVVSESNAAVRFNGSTAGFDGSLVIGGKSTGGRVIAGSPAALVNMKSIKFVGSNKHYLDNDTGETLAFAAESVGSDTGGVRMGFKGWPMSFRKVKCETNWPEVFLEADVETQTLELVLFNNSYFGKAAAYIRFDSGSNASFRGSLFRVTGETVCADTSATQYVVLNGGCFTATRPEGWPKDGQIVVTGNDATIGLAGDYLPSVTGPNAGMVFYCNSVGARWGFSAFGGDRTVCFDTPETELTVRWNAAQKFSDTTTPAVIDNSNKLSAYYLISPRLLFGNRSPWADGTVLFKNRIYTDGDNCLNVESHGRTVAVRLQGTIRTTGTIRVGGNDVGGCLAFEADNSGIDKQLTVEKKATVLVNGLQCGNPIVVANGSALGGTGTVVRADILVEHQRRRGAFRRRVREGRLSDGRVAADNQ